MAVRHPPQRLSSTPSGSLRQAPPPYGPETVVELDPEGWASRIFYDPDPDHQPAGDVGSEELTYDPSFEGLLRSYNDRRGNQHTFAYDGSRLRSDVDVAAGTSWTLSEATPADLQDGTWEYGVTSPRAWGGQSTYTVRRGEGQASRVTSNFDGTTTTVTRDLRSGVTSATTQEHPDGSTVSSTLSADPYYGWSFPVASSACSTLPSGAQVAAQESRSYQLDPVTREPSIVTSTSSVVLEPSCDPDTWPAAGPAQRVRTSEWHRLADGSGEARSISSEGRRTRRPLATAA